MKKGKKGNSTLAIIIVLVVVAVLGLVVYMNNYTPAPSQEAQVPTIQNANDLKAASSDLDNTNLNQIDNTQNQINSDSSNF